MISAPALDTPPEPTIGSVQRALVLKTFPGFVDLSASELAVLAAITRERFFEQGATLLTPGTPVQAFYLIAEGRVQMYEQGQPTRQFGSRAAVGGLASLTRDPAGAHVVALEDTLALEVDQEDMADVFEDHFHILLGVLRAIARTLREVQLAAGGQSAAMSTPEISQIDTSEPLGLVERLWFLRHATAFRDTSIEALAELAHESTEVRYRAGERIWSRPERAEWSLQVVKGEVRCEPATGEPFVFGAGYVVGGVDSLAVAEHSYDATAKTDVVALRLRSGDFLDVLEDHPDISMELMRNMAQGIVATAARLGPEPEQVEQDAPPSSGSG